MAPSTLYRWYYPARQAAGRKDLRWHDLRHTSATMAAETGDWLLLVMLLLFVFLVVIVVAQTMRRVQRLWKTY